MFCPIISADDHLLEPPDLFTAHVPAPMRDVAPHLEFRDYQGDQVPYWVIDDDWLPIYVNDGSVGRPSSEWTRAPQRFDEFRRGVWDVDERVRDMDLNGTWASLAFSSFNFGFAGSRFTKIRDRELGVACLHAYNDWMIESWAGAHPDRFIPLQMAWLGDPEVAAAEVRRNAARGCHAISFSEHPGLALGFPSIFTDHWDPLLRACEETETVVNLHVGSSGTVHTPAPDAPADAALVLFPVHGMNALVNWVYARIPVRFPRLKIALSEGGVSWVPMVMERFKRAYRTSDRGNCWDPADGDPVDLVRRNFWFTSIEDPSAFRVLDTIGEDRVMVEVDYPHGDTSWPDTQELLRGELSHLPVATIRKVCYGNAAALYQHPEPPEALIASSVIGGLPEHAIPADAVPARH